MTDALLPWIFLVGFVVSHGGLALVKAARNRKRRVAFAEYCLSRGFTFEDKRPNGERRYADMFEPFTAGRRRSWGCTISGTKNQVPFTAFEYQWVTGGGKSSSTHRIGGIVWERDKDSLPRFALSPEGWLSRLGQVFGMEYVDVRERARLATAQVVVSGIGVGGIGPLVSGYLQVRGGYQLAFSVSAAFYLLAGVMFLLLFGRTRLPSEVR